MKGKYVYVAVKYVYVAVKYVYVAVKYHEPMYSFVLHSMFLSRYFYFQ